MWEFIHRYFIDPVLANGWFNPVNTATYSIILVVAVYLVYRMLVRMNIRIDGRFIIAVMPFIAWASTTRVLHDAAFAGRLSPALNAFYNSPVFPTPGSYFITFSLALAVLITSLGVQRFSRIPYWKTMTSIGTALVLVNISMIPVESLFPLWLIGGIVALWSGVFFSWRIAIPLIGTRLADYYHILLSKENLAILSAHFLDATATVVAMTHFGYLEQHVVPRMLLPLMGPYAMFFLKIAVVLPALWAIDRYGGDAQFKRFLKLVVLILGLAPGLRNTVRLAVMV